MTPRNVLLLVVPASPVRLQGIVRFAKEHGWHLMLGDRLAAHPAMWDGDGVLCTLRASGEMTDAALRLRRRRIPIVDLTNERPSLDIPRVVCDHREIGRLAASHFSEKHFKRAAWISTTWTHVHALRFAGLCERWRGEAPCKWVASDELPPEKLEDGKCYAAFLSAKLRAAPKPLAVFAYDDADAARVLGICLAAGISVPAEVALLGVGDERIINEYQPIPLSSIDQDLARNGYEGAALLERLMNGEKPPAEPILVPPRGIVQRQSTDATAVQNAILRNALLFISNNIGRSFGTEQIADALGIAPAALSELFAEELGHSPVKEIAAQRLAKVKLLLSGSSLSIAEIAWKTGFCTPSHLSNSFRAATGMTPRQWRSRA